ncbi:MAG TPA: hypothetical protein VML75_09805 [Kofleriaceae bacterium]|nr:hypothetical protein [Kofleriaceae bacterium]
MKRAGTILGFLTCLLASSACNDLGDVSGPNDIDEDPGAIGRTCEAELSVTGSFVPDGTGLDEEGGCLPMGAWTLNVEVTSTGDCDAVPVAGEYKYTVVEDDAGYEVIYEGDPTSMYTFGKITLEGPCQGSFEHYGTDGLSLTLLKPYTTPELDILGIGTYETYETNQLE